MNLYQQEIKFINDLISEANSMEDMTILYKYKVIQDVHKNLIAKSDLLIIYDVIKRMKFNKEKYIKILSCVADDIDYYSLVRLDYNYRGVNITKSKKRSINKFIEWAGL